MAIDTKNKRMSVIGLALPVPSMLPDSDGTIAIADRLHLLWLYSGIAAATPAVFVVSAIVKIRALASMAVKIRETASAEVDV